MIIDGKAVADNLLVSLKDEVDALNRRGVEPCLALIIAGDDQASKVYVRNKIRACEKVGIKSVNFEFSDTVTERELLNLIDNLNADKTVHGILVQVPLPKGLDERKILARILPAKDVDGFCAEQVGKLFLGEPQSVACTPYGIVQLLKAYDIPMEGKHAVIVNRSNTVGKPLIHLLLAQNATVTVCHSKTVDIAKYTRDADIVVTAVGKAGFLTADMVKASAVVIDAGINRNEAGKLCGDADFDGVSKVAGYITPVPGGVGPMTVAMLMKNTVDAAKRMAE